MRGNERIRAAHAIALRELYRVMRELGRVVETYVREPEILDKVTSAWLATRVQPNGTRSGAF